MTSIALPVERSVRDRSTLVQLTRIEMKRFARHPLFLIGLALATMFSAGQYGPIELDYHVIPSFFIGVFGLIVAARLTTATDRTRPVVDSAPITETMRTAALCLACLVPATACLLVVLLHRAFVLADPIPDWRYGGYGTTDRFLVSVVIPVIACLGAPLLGVAVGRWLHFPGAALITVIMVLFWSNLSGYLPTQGWEDDSVPARLLHLASPYTAFAMSNGDSHDSATLITRFPGSPFWYAVWTLALCGLAVVAALWHGADRRTRRSLGRAFAGLVALALVALTLSVSVGNQTFQESRVTGITSAAAPASPGR